MFTVHAIEEAHSRVKSGADFPQYIRDLYDLGIRSYEIFVRDGHASYLGQEDFVLSTPAAHATVAIAQQVDVEQFKIDLKSHQAGETDYQTFCADCARAGVDKWIVDLEGLHCTYYDSEGRPLLTEKIPG